MDTTHFFLQHNYIINLEAKDLVLYFWGKWWILCHWKGLGMVWKELSRIFKHERVSPLPDVSQAVCWQLSKEGAHESVMRGHWTWRYIKGNMQVSTAALSVWAGSGALMSRTIPQLVHADPLYSIKLTLQSLDLPIFSEVTSNSSYFLKWPSFNLYQTGNLSLCLMSTD